MPPTLKVVSGANEAIVPGGRPFVVGRAKSADFVLDDPQVSRRHLLIEPVGDGWAVRDISSNGTWLDGRRVGRVDVHDALLLRLGGVSGPQVAVIAAGARRPSLFDLPTVGPDSPDADLAAQRSGDQLSGAAAGGPAPVGAASAGAASAGAGPARGAKLEAEHERRTVHQVRRGTISIGRSQDNDIVVGDLLASRTHAELLVGRGGIEVVDLDSANGTFVNGHRVARALLVQQDVIAVGHHVFQLVGDELIEYIDSGEITFEADGLNVFIGGNQLLHDVSFRLPGSTLLAVIGPSGSGKSTLLNALTGFRPADSGTVRYAGRDMYSDYDELRRRIGYVPQDDILHTALTVREALEYGAELRFPAETTKAERRVRVNEVLEELGLTADAERLQEQRYADAVHGGGGLGGAGHNGAGFGGGTPPDGSSRNDLANRKVENLSGGQRKRTSVALELLTQPTLLYLDEPTSGLDPGLDKEVMESLRRLADGGRTVIVVTHSVAQLDMCDYVLALAQGGHIAYFGPPQDALSFFNEGDWADVFRMLKTGSGSRKSADRFRSSRYFVAASVRAPVARKPEPPMRSIRQQSLPSQIMTLSRRYLRVIASDRTYLRLIIVFPFLLGIIPRIVPAETLGPLPPQEILGVPQVLPNLDAQSVLLLLVLCACFMGVANAIREIVKERAIYRRERSIGLSRTAYLASKVGVLTLITTLQSAVFTTIAVYGKAPPDAVVLSSPFLETLLAVVILSWSSAMTGLLVSAWADNADKTMPLLVLVTIAQLVFSGGFLPLEGMTGLQQISWLFPSRWGFAAVASTDDLNDVLQLGTMSNPDTRPDPLWAHTSSAYVTNIVVGTILSLVMVFVTLWLLRRLDPKVVHRKRKDAVSPG